MNDEIFIFRKCVNSLWNIGWCLGATARANANFRVIWRASLSISIVHNSALIILPFLCHSQEYSYVDDLRPFSVLSFPFFYRFYCCPLVYSHRYEMFVRKLVNYVTKRSGWKSWCDFVRSCLNFQYKQNGFRFN